MTSITFDRLENIKTKTEKLYRAGAIKNITKKLFVQIYNSIYNEIDYYIMHPELCEDWELESIVSQIEECNYVLSTIENGSDERKYKKYFSEILSRIENFDITDLWIIRVPFYKTPGCRFLSCNNELSFILQIPEKPNYLDNALLGILAHEPAHIHQIVESMVDSTKQEKRKIGESLADILAFSIVEYMFTYSSVYLVREIIGVSKANEITGSHPSWLARVTVLRSMTDEIWNNSVVVQRNLEAFDKLLKISPTLSTTEEHLVQAILKEAKRWRCEWIKYKTDEDLLSNLKDLNEDIEIGEIPKMIRELIIGCTS